MTGAGHWPPRLGRMRGPTGAFVPIGDKTVIELARRRFSVDEYHRMAEAGILHEDDRVELIEGEIVQMSPIGSRHAACVGRLTHLFALRLGTRVQVWVQNPIRLGHRSEPQPDLALLKLRPDCYAGAHPGSEAVFLVIEVAETSAEYDRHVKLALYSRAGIPEAWLVDLAGDAVEVYRRPGAAGYAQLERWGRGERLSIDAIPEWACTVDDVIGPSSRA